MQSPFSEGGQLTKDGRIGVANLNYDKSTNDIKPEVLEKVENAAFTARSPQLQVEHGGPGAEIVRFNNSQGPSEFFGVIAAAIVLLITFGSLVAAGLPLIATLLALGTSLGIITLLSHVVDTPDFASQLASLIGLGVGIDYALFVVTRYRAEVRAGLDRDDAVEMAIDTAGRTVMFAAITVVIALLGLLLLGLNFMQGVALGAATAVLATMFAALTIIPALIGGSGEFMDGVLHEYDERGGFRFWGTKHRFSLPGREWRARRSPAASASAPRDTRGSAGRTPSRPARGWPPAIAVVVLLALALPATQMRLGSSDAGLDPPGTTTREAYDLIAEGFGAGTNGSFLLVAELAQKGDKAAAQKIADAVRPTRTSPSSRRPRCRPTGTWPRSPPTRAPARRRQATTDTLKRLRDDVVPAVERDTGARVEVGGFTASNEDFSRVVASKLPLFVGVVVLFSALLLLVVFRSVIIPIKAAVLNLLSIGAALGFVTLVFQEGHGSSLLGIGTGPIDSFVPVLMFAIVFGLSMDYEVFLISRVHEEWERTNDASASVARGLQTTGRVITAAASIMILVFASFALGDDRIIKLFGLGLASAVFFDAVIIRCLLVPALMEIFGRRAWWLPSWLDRRLPRLAIESPECRTYPMASPRPRRPISPGAAAPPSARARGGWRAAACAAPPTRAPRPSWPRCRGAARPPCTCSRARCGAAPPARAR